MKGLTVKITNMILSQAVQPHSKDSTSITIHAYWFITTQDKWICRRIKVHREQKTARRAFFSLFFPFSPQREWLRQVSRTIMNTLKFNTNGQQPRSSFNRQAQFWSSCFYFFIFKFVAHFKIIKQWDLVFLLTSRWPLSVSNRRLSRSLCDISEVVA